VTNAAQNAVQLVSDVVRLAGMLVDKK